MSSDAKLVADALRDCGMVQPALMIEKRLAERESRGREHAADAPTSTKGDSYQAGSHPAPSPNLDREAAARRASARIPLLSKEACADIVDAVLDVPSKPLTEAEIARVIQCSKDCIPDTPSTLDELRAAYEEHPVFPEKRATAARVLIAALEAENARLQDDMEEQLRAHLEDQQRAEAAERKLEECAAAYKTVLETTRHARGTAERERGEARAEINQAVEEAAAQRHAYVETATELANTKAELARLQPKPLDDEAMKQLAGYTREVYLRAGCGCEKQEHYEWPSAEGLSTWCGVVRAVLAAGAKP